MAAKVKNPPGRPRVSEPKRLVAVYIPSSLADRLRELCQSAEPRVSMTAMLEMVLEKHLEKHLG